MESPLIKRLPQHDDDDKHASEVWSASKVVKFLFALVVACGVGFAAVNASVRLVRTTPPSSVEWSCAVPFVVLQVLQLVNYTLDVLVSTLASFAFILIILGFALPYACCGKHNRSDYE